MTSRTTIEITKGNRKELIKVQKYLEETRHVNACANDALAHLLAFWEQKREDKGKENRAPEQGDVPPSA